MRPAGREREVLGPLHADAVEVVASSSDREVPACWRDLQPGRALGCPGATDDVDASLPRVVQLDVTLLVEVRVEDEAAGLVQHGAEVLLGVEGRPSEVAGHGSVLVAEACVEAVSEELAEHGAKVVLTPWEL